MKNGEFEFKGIVKEIFPIKTYNKKDDTQGRILSILIVEDVDKYPKSLVGAIFKDDLINNVENNLSEGMKVTVSAEIKADSYKSKTGDLIWQSKVTIFDIKAEQSFSSRQPQQRQAQPKQEQQPTTSTMRAGVVTEDSGDLPF